MSSGIIRRILDYIKNINISVEDIDKAIKYLQYYKYLKENDFNIEDFLQAIINFQKRFGLNDNEGLTLQTITAMEWKRCGCPDFITEAATDTNKWAYTNLKYFIESFVPGLSKDEQRLLTKQAANDSSAVCGLSFEEVFNENQAHIVLTTGRSNGLGSSGGTLAYAYLPNSNSHTSQLTAVFDLADLWIKDTTKRGILYKNVAAHEVFSGHSVGLTHSKVSSALMAPFYSPSVDKPQQNDDIIRLQVRYGKPKIVAPTNPDPQPPVQTPTSNTETIIRIRGPFSIDGYRITKLG